MADVYDSATPRRINPLDLDLEYRTSQTVLVYQDEPLVAPDGNLVRDEAKQVMEVVLDDLRTTRQLVLFGRQLELPENLSCYEIHVRCWRERGRSGEDDLATWCKEDPILSGLLREPLRFAEVRTVLEYLRGGQHSLTVPHSDAHGWASGVWNELDEVQRAVVRVLIGRHSAAFTVALAFALRGVDAKQYARGVWRVREREHESFRSEDAALQFRYFEEIRRDAWKAERYIGAGIDQLGTLFLRGENRNLEFKATLRKNVHTEKVDKAVLGASLKTIAAFLNTDGGVLAIGVTDDGRTVQSVLELDEFRTEDKYLLHLFSKMRDTFGGAASSAVTACFEDVRGCRVCVVRCSKSSVPVFAAINRGTEEFFIRNGPSTESLSLPQAVRYIRSRFPDYRG